MNKDVEDLHIMSEETASTTLQLKLNVVAHSISIVKKQSTPTPQRAYSPSDYYYHTSTQGGINASLTK
jgi:hypothetical protein